MALRDVGPPPRITVYDDEGRFERDWLLPSGAYAIVGGRAVIQADADGLLWLPVTGRSSRNHRSTTYLLYTPDGAARGRALTPDLTSPEKTSVQLSQSLVNGGVRRVGWTLPFQPERRWAWSPFGMLATINTAEYRVAFASFERLQDSSTAAQRPPHGVPTRWTEISRRITPVTVPDPERQDRWNALHSEVITFPGGSDLRIPEVLSRKPPLRDVRFSEDGRLLVMVSTPSVKSEGRWREPEAYDVFSTADRLLGRVRFPLDFHLVRLRASRACGVVRGPDDVESVRCYTINLPPEPASPISGRVSTPR
ncbi:MAG TPA: hypothetical protein VFN22_10760 [Gemmatimonadales bacterium]|nr:hypothetical protein [Gemmatimonadales bacterium]